MKWKAATDPGLSEDMTVSVGAAWVDGEMTFGAWGKCWDRTVMPALG